VNSAPDANSALNAKNDGSSAFGNFWNGWYTGANYATSSPSTDYDNQKAYNKLVAPKDENGPFQRNW